MLRSTRRNFIEYLLLSPIEASPTENKNYTWTYSHTQKYKEEHIETNIKYCKKCDLEINEQNKPLPIMHGCQKCITHPLMQDS